LFLKRNYLRLIGAEVRDSCGSSGTGETPQAFTPRRLTARPAESEHLEGKSTTTHYLVNSNKVCENSLLFKKRNVRYEIPGDERLEWKSTNNEGIDMVV
jgi:hypothetical protein